MPQPISIQIHRKPESRFPKIKFFIWTATSLMVASSVAFGLTRYLAQSLKLDPKEDDSFIKRFLHYPLLGSCYALALYLTIDAYAGYHYIKKKITSRPYRIFFNRFNPNCSDFLETPPEQENSLESVRNLMVYRKRRSNCFCHPGLLKSIFGYVAAPLWGVVPALIPILSLLIDDIRLQDPDSQSKMIIPLLVLGMLLAQIQAYFTYQNNQPEYELPNTQFFLGTINPSEETPLCSADPQPLQYSVSSPV